MPNSANPRRFTSVRVCLRSPRALGVPRIIFNYQNQPARLEPSGKAFRPGGPRLPVPDPFGQGLATGMAPATVNPALLGKWYGPAERNRSAALQAPHLAPIPLRVWFWPASPYPGSKQPAEETMKRTMMICALACTAIAATCTPSASQSRIQAGVLECRGAPSAGYLLGSASLELRPAGPGSGYVGRRQHHRKHVYR